MTDRIVAALLVGISLGLGPACTNAGSAATASGPPDPTGDPGSARGESAGDAATGSVHAQLTLPPGRSFDVVLWTITEPASGGIVQNGRVDVKNSLVISFIVGNLPAAAGYRVGLYTTASDGVYCEGGSTFDVAPRSTTPVAVAMACNVAGAGISRAVPALPPWAVVLLGLGLMGAASVAARRRRPIKR
jgi:hypothetical protein